MEKHLQIFEDMVEGEVEFPSNLLLEHKEGNLLYTIEGREAFVWDEEEEVEVGDYSYEVVEMINERVDSLEKDHQAEKETEDYLRRCR